MAVPTVCAMRRLDGQGSHLLTMTVGATAVKQGDPCMIGAAQNLVVPITAATDVVVGVATHDAIVGAEVRMIPADGMQVFKFRCKSDKKYVDGTDRWTLCDFVVFTAGAMTIDPATDAGHSIYLIKLADGETDNSNGNAALGVFNLKYVK